MSGEYSPGCGADRIRTGAGCPQASRPPGCSMVPGSCPAQRRLSGVSLRKGDHMAVGGVLAPRHGLAPTSSAPHAALPLGWGYRSPRAAIKGEYSVIRDGEALTLSFLRPHYLPQPHGEPSRFPRLSGVSEMFMAGFPTPAPPMAAGLTRASCDCPG